MRDRWQKVSRLWEENKAPANKLDLVEQLDYYGKLSAQLEWRAARATGRSGWCTTNRARRRRRYSRTMTP